MTVFTMPTCTDASGREHTIRLHRGRFTLLDHARDEIEAVAAAKALGALEVPDCIDVLLSLRDVPACIEALLALRRPADNGDGLHRGIVSPKLLAHLRVQHDLHLRRLAEGLTLRAKNLPLLRTQGNRRAHILHRTQPALLDRLLREHHGIEANSVTYLDEMGRPDRKACSIRWIDEVSINIFVGPLEHAFVPVPQAHDFIRVLASDRPYVTVDIPSDWWRTVYLRGDAVIDGAVVLQAGPGPVIHVVRERLVEGQRAVFVQELPRPGCWGASP